MNKLQFIRGKIIEANKSILDLKFGCEFEWKEELKDKESFIAVFENWLSRSDRTIRCLMHLGQQGIVEESHIVKIIGRPLHLEDFLLAVEGIGDDGIEMDNHSKIGFFTFSQTDIHYNLKEPFENQSQEFYDFAYEILK